MYSEGSVVGKASTIGIEILPTTPLIFTRVKKCENWRRFQHRLNFSRPRLKMQQDIGILKKFLCSRDRRMSSPSLMKLGPRTPENRSVKVPHPLKLHGKNMLNRQ